MTYSNSTVDNYANASCVAIKISITISNILNIVKDYLDNL